MPHFNITYDIVTPESAEHGDTAEAGFIAKGQRLSDAIDDLFATRTNAVDGITCVELSSSDPASARWISVVNGMEFETGAVETRSLALPGRHHPCQRAAHRRTLQGALGATTSNQQSSCVN